MTAVAVPGRESPLNAFSRQSGISFSGCWRGAQLFEPWQITASIPNV
jgi:hypothetical protein